MSKFPLPYALRRGLRIGLVVVGLELAIGWLLFLLMFGETTTSFIAAQANIYLAVSLLLVYLGTKWYFKDLAIPGHGKQGLTIGSVVVVLRLLLAPLLAAGMLFTPEHFFVSGLYVLLLTPFGMLLQGITLFTALIVGWEEKRHRAFHADINHEAGE